MTLAQRAKKINSSTDENKFTTCSHCRRSYCVLDIGSSLMIPLSSFMCSHLIANSELTLSVTECILRDIIPLISDDDIIEKLIQFKNMEIKYSATTFIIVDNFLYLSEKY